MAPLIGVNLLCCSLIRRYFSLEMEAWVRGVFSFVTSARTDSPMIASSTLSAGFKIPID